MDEKKALIIQDFSMNEAAVGKYDFLKECDMELDVVQDAHDISKDELTNRLLIFEIKGPNALPVNVETVEKIRDVHIVTSHFSPVNTTVTEKAGNLETICILRSEVENVDLKVTSRKGVKVSNAPERLAVVMFEFTAGMICAETKNITRTHVNMMEGVWKNRHYNSEYAIILGKRNIGLVGYETIGTRVAGTIASFGVDILVYDPRTPEDKIQEDGYEPVGLNELCSRLDVVSIHYRLMPETKNMIGGEQLGLIKPHALLISSARAGPVDKECLIDALKNYRAGGMVLDVFHEESLGPDNPYLRVDSVTLTPHIAGTVSNSDELTLDIIEHTLRHYSETGEWMHVVNQEKDERIDERGIG